MIVKLANLIQGLPGLESKFIAEADLNIDINNVSLNSNDISVEGLFVAYPGTSKDGRDYIQQAINNGASAVVYDPINYELPTFSKNIPIIAVKQLAKYTGVLASNFFNNPSQNQKIYAVTGTNGKTTCAYFVAQLLNCLNEQAGFIGTIGYGIVDQQQNKLQKLDTTTPSPIAMQGLLAEFKKQNVNCVALEASSHALVQHRLMAVNIATAIFTNLSQDHLDYHQSLEEYYQAKKKLFFFPTLQNIIINIDDPYGLRLFQELSKHQVNSSNTESQSISTPTILLYSLKPASLELYKNPIVIFDQPANKLLLKNFEVFNLGAYISLPLIMPENLIGEFNLHNVLAVIGALISNKYSLNDILSNLMYLKPPPGRMEIFCAREKNIKLVVDYAHTPDALQKSLVALRQHFGKSINKIWCVFGCGGDRDKSKRPLMGEIAALYADQVILTDDNPRTEEPASIIKDIEIGFGSENKVKIFAIIHDRREAIQTALAHAQDNDAILIAGKGHEDYQIYGTMRTNYYEREFVAGLVT